MTGSAGVREVLLDGLALVWPTVCVGCGAPDRDCCAECLRELRARQLWRGDHDGVPAFASATYDGVVRAVLVAFKHGGKVRFARQLGWRLREPLAAAMACAVGPAPPLLVVAPSRPSRTRERGYRHVELLLRAALRGAPPRPECAPVRVLRTLPGRRSQVGLTPAARARNAARVAVRRGVRARVAGREVVLIDDVMTTGATLRAARLVLEEAGATVVAIAVLCVAVRGAPGVGKCSDEGVES